MLTYYSEKKPLSFINAAFVGIFITANLIFIAISIFGYTVDYGDKEKFDLYLYTNGLWLLILKGVPVELVGIINLTYLHLSRSMAKFRFLLWLSVILISVVLLFVQIQQYNPIIRR